MGKKCLSLLVAIVWQCTKCFVFAVSLALLICIESVTVKGGSKCIKRGGCLDIYWEFIP